VLLIFSSAAGAQGIPEGVEQILPRGQIAAVFYPVFVPASEAEIPGEAWVPTA
jgi:hypothetical protein